ncbi:metal-sensitive transcriptional regulator [Staphylococcus felis]|uniref:Metal-sensitive transcriptional regulator n=1 Tax=Staphylococcus felis TaxID=46127 RepID=A0A3E0IR62_9STAP|nr:metal-sensitive transcriptional regulator [Staphylococcus felis]REH89370.1 metal-sensitive transcriptional regulator [Staphylococcus felis]REH98272.1 metal-sensitive transcriptional regulator [Staphylococcus felis]
MHYDAKMKNRIKRVQGQLNGILKMMEDDAHCKDVVTQVSASKNALQRLIGVIVSENLVECVKTAEKNNEDTQALIDEAVELLVKSK